MFEVPQIRMYILIRSFVCKDNGLVTSALGKPETSLGTIDAPQLVLQRYVNSNIFIPMVVADKKKSVTLSAAGGWGTCKP